jgi:hypothetical protein
MFFCGLVVLCDVGEICGLVPIIECFSLRDGMDSINEETVVRRAYFDLFLVDGYFTVFDG